MMDMNACMISEYPFADTTDAHDDEVSRRVVCELVICRDMSQGKRARGASTNIVDGRLWIGDSIG
jgi:hypothetical protein